MNNCKDCGHPMYLHYTYFKRKWLGIFGLRKQEPTNCVLTGCGCPKALSLRGQSDGKVK